MATRKMSAVAETIRWLGLLAALCMLPGCSSMMASAANGMAKDLSAAMLNHDDPELVASAIPAYLLMMDAMIQSHPKNASVLRSGAKLYGAYASLFVKDPRRSKRLARRAFDYSLRAFCIRFSQGCGVEKMVFDDFKAVIDKLGRDDVETLYALGSSWAGWIRANSDDWSAIAKLAQVKAVMQRVIELDESYDLGGAHMYLGVLGSLIPPASGGRPEEAKAHFERAVTIAKDKNLLPKVYYAQYYARLMFDRPLHDKLLNEVIIADPKVDGFVLINTMAQSRAIKLLREADEFF